VVPINSIAELAAGRTLAPGQGRGRRAQVDPERMAGSAPASSLWGKRWTVAAAAAGSS